MIKNKQIFSIRETAETLVSDQLGRASYGLALGLIVLMVIIISVSLAYLPTHVPLYFTLTWGESRLAPKLMLYLLPSVSLLLAVLNLALSKLSSKLSPLLPKVLSVTSSVVAAMMMISLLGIIQSLIL